MTLEAEIGKQAEQGFILEKMEENFRQYFNVNNQQHRLVMDTFIITNDAFDGYVSNAGADYQTVHDAAVGYYSSIAHNVVGQEFTSPTYWVNRVFLRFDTSGVIPDVAVITAAKLKLFVNVNWSDDDFVIRIQKWMGGPPIGRDDYSAFDGVNYDDGNFNTRDLSLIEYNDIIFSDFSVINKTGYTDLCIRSNKDISSITPTRLELVNFQDIAPVGEIEPNPPMLEVTWLLLDICSWIDDQGGPDMLTMENIFVSIDSYLYNTPPAGYTFIPTLQNIFGVIDYYLGFNGDAKTGCNYY